MDTIDLGYSSMDKAMPSSMKEDKNKRYYPTLYCSGISGAENLPSGEFSFSGKGKLVSKTITDRDGKKSTSFEIEVHEITPEDDGDGSDAEDSGDSLDDALTEIESKKEDMGEDGEE